MTENHDPGAKFLSLAVHELRTPVSVVSGYLRMLLRHFGDSLTDQQRALVELGEKSCGSITALLAQLSELAQLEGEQASLRREPIRLVPLLADVAKDVPEGADRGIALTVRPDAPDVQVLGDPGRLTAAFATLAVAVLRERADPSPMQVACRVVETAEGRLLKTAIDEASTIDAALEDRDHDAFDEFRGGLGFRLLLASRIISAHGGRIVSPNAARGHLSIVVTLPVAPDATGVG
jgi:two-component system, OmpR family, sensor kinase